MKKILTVLCLLATGSVFANPQLIAHRGGTGDAPENTLPAIKLALENHAQAIWITVQLSRDGVPVLYRSSDLSALTNAEGKVSSLTAAELAKVDAGWKWGDDSHPWRGKQATIPTLQSVLQQWPQTFFYIDIKSPDAEPAVMGERLLEVLKIPIASTGYGFIPPKTAISPLCRNRSPALLAAAKPEPGLQTFRSATSASKTASAMAISGTGWN